MKKTLTMAGLATLACLAAAPFAPAPPPGTTRWSRWRTSPAAWSATTSSPAPRARTACRRSARPGATWLPSTKGIKSAQATLTGIVMKGSNPYDSHWKGQASGLAMPPNAVAIKEPTRSGWSAGSSRWKRRRSSRRAFPDNPGMLQFELLKTEGRAAAPG